MIIDLMVGVTAVQANVPPNRTVVLNFCKIHTTTAEQQNPWEADIFQKTKHDNFDHMWTRQTQMKDTERDIVCLFVRKQ